MADIANPTGKGLDLSGPWARAGGAANNASATVHSDEFWLVRDAGAPFEYNGGAVTCA